MQYEVAAAAGAGLIGGTAMVVPLYMGRAMMPARRRMGLLLLLGGILIPPLPLVVAVAVGGAVTAGVAGLTGRASKKKHKEVIQELEGVLDSLERGDDLALPPASWRRWVKRQAKRFRVDLFGELHS